MAVEQTTLALTDREVARKFRVYREREAFASNAEALEQLLNERGERSHS